LGGVAGGGGGSCYEAAAAAANRRRNFLCRRTAVTSDADAWSFVPRREASRGAYADVVVPFSYVLLLSSFFSFVRWRWRGSATSQQLILTVDLQGSNGRGPRGSKVGNLRRILSATHFFFPDDSHLRAPVIYFPQISLVLAKLLIQLMLLEPLMQLLDSRCWILQSYT
jgi:hypothetical protein